MADVRIVIGRKYEIMHDQHRQAIAEFAEQLRNSGLSVDLEVIDYEPEQYGLTPVEWTAFFIGTSVASTLISNITTDLCNGAKKMLRGQPKAKDTESGSTRQHLGFTIYGPDGHIIAKWTTQEYEAALNPAEIPENREQD